MLHKLTNDNVENNYTSSMFFVTLKKKVIHKILKQNNRYQNFKIRETGEKLDIF